MALAFIAVVVHFVTVLVSGRDDGRWRVSWLVHKHLARGLTGF
ncbi:hypothetical protein [Mesorhizobium sp. CAU 1732]